MQQDLFDETLDKKIIRMEKWVMRLQKELWFLKQVHDMARTKRPEITIVKKENQLDIFAPWN